MQIWFIWSLIWFIGNIHIVNAKRTMEKRFKYKIYKYAMAPLPKRTQLFHEEEIDGTFKCNRTTWLNYHNRLKISHYHKIETANYQIRCRLDTQVWAAFENFEVISGAAHVPIHMIWVKRQQRGLNNGENERDEDGRFCATCTKLQAGNHHCYRAFIVKLVWPHTCDKSIWLMRLTSH